VDPAELPTARPRPSTSQSNEEELCGWLSGYLERIELIQRDRGSRIAQPLRAGHRCCLRRGECARRDPWTLTGGV
jgi:hypothetical protein